MDLKEKMVKRSFNWTVPIHPIDFAATAAAVYRMGYSSYQTLLLCYATARTTDRSVQNRCKLADMPRELIKLIGSFLYLYERERLATKLEDARICAGDNCRFLHHFTPAKQQKFVKLLNARIATSYLTSPADTKIFIDSLLQFPRYEYTSPTSITSHTDNVPVQTSASNTDNSTAIDLSTPTTFVADRTHLRAWAELYGMKSTPDWDADAVKLGKLRRATHKRRSDLWAHSSDDHVENLIGLMSRRWGVEAFTHIMGDFGASPHFHSFDGCPRANWFRLPRQSYLRLPLLGTGPMHLTRITIDDQSRVAFDRVLKFLCLKPRLDYPAAFEHERIREVPMFRQIQFNNNASFKDTYFRTAALGEDFCQDFNRHMASLATREDWSSPALLDVTAYPHDQHPDVKLWLPERDPLSILIRRDEGGPCVLGEARCPLRDMANEVELMTDSQVSESDGMTYYWQPTA